MNHKAQRGLSLIEIMVALTLTMILALGISSIYLGAKRSYAFQNDFSSIQENGRYAIEQMARDLRMAGYFGCASHDLRIANRLNVAPGHLLADFGNSLRAYSPASGFSAAAAAGDALVIHRAAPGGGLLTVESHSLTGALIKVAEPHDLGVGEIILLNDCENLAIVQTTANTQSSGNNHQIGFNTGAGTPGNCLADSSPHHLGVATGQTTANCQGGGFGAHSYDGKSVFVMRAESVAYYIGADNVLVRREADGSESPVVDGVEDMRLLFGVDSSGDGAVDNYVAVATVEAAGQWGDVVSVRIHLLLAGASENVMDAPQTYRFFNQQVTATDRRLRQPMTATIGIRNRLR